MFKSTYTCSPEQFLEKAKIPTRVMKDEPAMYEEIAQIMFDTIKNNGNDRTVIICPVGPIGHYPVFAKKVNEARLSLKNCWFVNMDEYLTNDDEVIAYENPLRFKAIMDKMLYSQIDPELIMPKSQRLFPEPGHEAEIDKLLEELGGADCVLTGVGINGHIAFNEPPEAYEAVTDEEYRNIGTRCLNISRETITNNGRGKIRGALDIFPRRCITLGMKQLLGAKMIKVYLYCDWQWGIMRKCALEGETKYAPVTFLQSHPNAEMVITEELYNTTII